MTTVEKVIALQDLDLLADVPAEQLQYLAAAAEEVFYDTGDVVYDEGDPADALFVIVNGRVRLRRDEEVITNAGPGEAIGTWALFDESPRVVRAEIAEEARLLRIARDDFFDLLADHVQITQGVLKTVVKRMRALVQRVEAAAPKA